MKIIRAANPMEVKRCFAMTHYFRTLSMARHTDTTPTRAKYLATLKKAKKMSLGASERELDKILKWKRRIQSYNKAEWYVATASIKEIGVWRRAGGLPFA